MAVLRDKNVELDMKIASKEASLGTTHANSAAMAESVSELNLKLAEMTRLFDKAEEKLRQVQAEQNNQKGTFD